MNKHIQEGVNSTYDVSQGRCQPSSTGREEPCKQKDDNHHCDELLASQRERWRSEAGGMRHPKCCWHTKKELPTQDFISGKISL